MITKLLQIRSGAGDEHTESTDSLLLACLLLFHHPYFGPSGASQSWLDSALNVNRDPAVLAQNRIDQCLSLINRTLQDNTVNEDRKQAALNALTTLAFIAPQHYLPAVMQQVTKDLDPTSLDFVGAFELGVWGTPAGELFVDVLNDKKEVALNKNSKTYAQDKWDQEVRESIAKKKAAQSGGSLSKQEQQLVNAQTKKEEAVREQLTKVQQMLQRGLQLIRALLHGRTGVFDDHLQLMLGLVIGSAIGPAAFLIGSSASDLYLVRNDIIETLSQLSDCLVSSTGLEQGLSRYRFKYRSICRRLPPSSSSEFASA